MQSRYVALTTALITTLIFTGGTFAAQIGPLNPIHRNQLQRYSRFRSLIAIVAVEFLILLAQVVDQMEDTFSKALLTQRHQREHSQRKLSAPHPKMQT